MRRSVETAPDASFRERYYRAFEWCGAHYHGSLMAGLFPVEDAYSWPLFSDSFTEQIEGRGLPSSFSPDIQAELRFVYSNHPMYV